MTTPQLRVVEGDKMDKVKALDAALAHIEKQFGKGSIMKLGAKLLFDMGERRVERLHLVHLVPFDDPKLWCGHGRIPLFHELQSCAINVNVPCLFYFSKNKTCMNGFTIRRASRKG